MPEDLQGPIVDHVVLPLDSDYDYRVCNYSHILRNLQTINLFIGPTNSGKSRLLRRMFFLDIDKLALNDQVRALVQQYNKILDEFNSKLKQIFINAGQNGYRSLWRPKPVRAESNEDLLRELDALLEFFMITIPSSPDIEFARGKLLAISEEAAIKLHDGVRTEATRNKQRVYIPALRGLRNPSDGAEDVYKKRTVKDYFNNEMTRNVFTGLSLYDDIKSNLLGDHASRRRVNHYEQFLSTTFFGGAPVTLTPRLDADVISITIGEDDERYIYDLGDGMQHLIILTYPFFNRSAGRELLVFIEEPELYLHPGLQRRLLELYTSEHSYFKNAQIFMTTHSNHFLDMTLDFANIGIFRFIKENGLANTTRERLGRVHFSIEPVGHPCLSVLKELEVHNSSVFLTNCTIWVEGVSDRLYLRKYIELVKQVESEYEWLNEDTHYTIAEYAGSNLAHWLFVDEPLIADDADCVELNPVPKIFARRLCGAAMIVADRDTKKKEAIHERRLKELGSQYYVLSCREIENSLSLDILVKTVNSYIRDDNRKIKNRPSAASYSDKKMGQYITSLFQGVPPKIFADKDGTLRDKAEFAFRACSLMEDASVLTDEALNLAKTALRHISARNPQRGLKHQ